MKKLQLSGAILLFTLSYDYSYARSHIENLSLKDVSFKTLNYVLAEQIQDDTSNIYIKGEWPTQIKSTLVPVVAGVGKLFGHDDEATAFTKTIPEI